MESEFHSEERFLLWPKKFCLICWELLKGKHTRRSRNWFGEPLIFPRPSIYTRTSNSEHAVIKSFTSENLFLYQLLLPVFMCWSIDIARKLLLPPAWPEGRLHFMTSAPLHTSHLCILHFIIISIHLYIPTYKPSLYILHFILIIMACQQIPISHIPIRWE